MDFRHENTLSSADSELLWSRVAEHVETFLDEWETASDAPPDMQKYLPEHPVALRTMLLGELIKIDLEQRWQRNCQPRQIEFYLQRHPELVREQGPPLDLIYEEFHVRRQLNPQLSPHEYFKRFPDQEEPLRRLLNIQEPFVTTSAFGSRPPTDIHAGQQLDDFDLLNELGRGAFGAVFLARQRSMQRLVALKLSRDRGNEPQTLSRLDHPHIVRVYDRRKLDDRDLRLLYMQYVPGGTLHQALAAMRAIPREQWNGRALIRAVDSLLDETGVIPSSDSVQRMQLRDLSWPNVVCLIGSQLASALEYAHRQGVLHRDIKPANILLSESVLPKLVDFNISSCSKLHDSSPAAYFGGSLAYMSPEQLEACNPDHPREPDSLDGRCDTYSLAVVLWEMLTGSRPFGGEELSEDWVSTINGLTERRKVGLGEKDVLGAPREEQPLRRLLVKCLAPDRDARFESAAELATQLRLCQNPTAYELLTRPQHKPRSVFARFPVLTVVLTVLLPNILAGVMNYHYNRERWRAKLGGDYETFQQVVLIINSVLYPLGLVIGLALLKPIIVHLRARAKLKAKQSASLEVRQRALKMGHVLAMLSISAWIIGGFLYPIVIWILGGPWTIEEFLQFVISLSICGLMAASYPFFGATGLMTELWYPVLVAPGLPPREDVPLFQWLGRVCWWYLTMAAIVPFLTLVLLFNYAESEKVLLTEFFLGTIVLFTAVFRLARRIQANLSILADIVNNEEKSRGAAGE
ncbi:MAG: serine/threonine-protein kinase [Pirellulaceae bacterium]|nr:serine/threonine protein kinase [Planctomycetales bacterium]